MDADDEQSWERLGHLATALADEDVPAYLEKSRRGGHLWLFLAEAVAGREARAFGQGLLAAHQIEGVELYPKQDELADGPGSLIRMPFGVHRLTGHCYGFYTPNGAPLAPTIREQIYALGYPETVPEAAFEAYRSFVSPRPAATPTKPLEMPDGPVSEKIKASVTVLEFVSQYVDLKPTASGAVGLCPFHDDHNPSFGVNDEGNYWHCFAGWGGDRAYVRQAGGVYHIDEGYTGWIIRHRRLLLVRDVQARRGRPPCQKRGRLPMRQLSHVDLSDLLRRGILCRIRIGKNHREPECQFG